ncbi:MAG: hypothetical protein K2X81_19010 [Candidatus Obscuribacterales bacterium]|nr:hypothetical protein [Candidatus Obscuribacterales bacterium]
MANNEIQTAEKPSEKGHTKAHEVERSLGDPSDAGNKLSNEWLSEAVKAQTKTKESNPSSKEVEDFSDIKKLLKIPENKIADRAPSTEDKAKMAEEAKDIAATIGKHGDFHAGMKREQIEEAIKDAASKGKEYLDYLVKQINQELAKSNPDLMLTSSYFSQNGILSPEQTHAEVTLINTKTREPEDKIQADPETNTPIIVKELPHGIPYWEPNLKNHKNELEFDWDNWSKHDIYNNHPQFRQNAADQAEILK